MKKDFKINFTHIYNLFLFLYVSLGFYFSLKTGIIPLIKTKVNQSKIKIELIIIILIFLSMKFKIYIFIK